MLEIDYTTIQNNTIKSIQDIIEYIFQLKMNMLNNYDLRSVKNKNANIYKYSNVVIKFISTDSMIFASNLSCIFQLPKSS